MNKFALSTEEKAVADRISAALATLPESSQYNVLRFSAHMMDRDVVRKGSIRAAAAVAGSTARVLREAENEKKRAKRASRKTGGYPQSFKEGPAKQVLLKQARLKQAMSSPPTEEQKASLRETSKEVRDLFRAFNEGAN